MNRILTYYQSPIGVIRIIEEDSFISEVHFCESEDEIEISREETSPLLLECVHQLSEYFRGGLKEFVLPLQQPGTSFQQEVWNELMNIPFGATITYMDLAKRLGNPKIIRAAANANGKNKIAIIIPCHRVIGTNQQLVGYAGGLWRKKRLLELEAQYAHGVQALF